MVPLSLPSLQPRLATCRILGHKKLTPTGTDEQIQLEKRRDHQHGVSFGRVYLLVHMHTTAEATDSKNSLKTQIPLSAQTNCVLQSRLVSLFLSC